MDPWIFGSVAGAAAAASAAVCAYYILGALSLKQRAKRWLASCELDRGNRMGELEQPSAGRKR